MRFFSLWNPAPTPPFFKQKFGCTVWRKVDWAQVAMEGATPLNKEYLETRQMIDSIQEDISRLANTDTARMLQSNLDTVMQNCESLKNYILEQEPSRGVGCPEKDWYLSFIPKFSEIKNQAMQLKQAAARAIQAAAQAPAVATTAPTPTPTPAPTTGAGTLVMPGYATKGGEVVEGAGGRTERELLSTPGQSFFTRTTDVLDANLRWDDWQRLKEMLPSNFNEEKYLKNNPDVAEAVRVGAMPSGAWHYVMYGMPNCQSGQKKGTACDIRSFAGWRRRQALGGYARPTRRPGYLSGFSPWR